jgi:arginine/lysine/ornithine decarboxylase
MDFRKKITEASLGHIKLLEEYVKDEKSGNFYKDAAGTDPSRLTFIIDGVSGREAMDILDSRFNMVFEMAGRKHIVAITTVMDDEAAFSALYEAIVGLDDIIEKCCSDEFQKKYSEKNDAPEDYIIDTESGKKSLVNAVGMISKNTVYVYPPGIPFIHSGDMINEEMLSEIKRELENGGRLRFQ